MAVYFWTASEEFLTYDIDVVMDVPEELAKRLAELGFARVPDGLHWTLEGTDIFLEAPSSRLDADAVVSEYPPKRTRRPKPSPSSSGGAKSSRRIYHSLYGRDAGAQAE
jgi:hypothetical protein